MPSIQQFDTTMHLLHKVLDLRAKNQEVIAANIANAETPGYAARTFSFEQELHSALGKGDLRPVTSHPNTCRWRPRASTRCRARSPASGTPPGLAMKTA